MATRALREKKLAASKTSGPLSVQERTSSTDLNQRSYEKLALDIIALIEKDGLGVGDRLPSERTLAERFNVNRTAIREAIIALEIRGIADVRGGSGIYVSALKPSLLLKDAAPGPFELLGARLIVEPEVAAVAAIRATDFDLDALSGVVAELKLTMRDKRKNEAADRKFHVSIAAATGNAVLVQLIELLWNRVRGAMWAKLEEHFHTPELRAASMRDHQNIFASLVARNAEEARRAMRSHIERVMREFAQGWR